MLDLQSCAILFLISVITTHVVRTIFAKTRTKVHLPPSPMALPIFGHLHLLGRTPPHQTFQKLSTRHGPVLYLLFGSIPHIIVSSAEMAKEFLRTHELSFAARPQSEAARILTYNFADFSFIPHGPYWKFMKKLCMSELLGGRMMDQFFPIRRDEIHRFVKFLLKKSEAKEAVDLDGELIRLSNNVISRMALRTTCSRNEDEAEEVKNLILEMADVLAKFNIGEFVWIFKKFGMSGYEERVKDIHRRFDGIMERVMKEHEEGRRMKKEGGDGGDEVKGILDILLDIAEDENSEMKLTRDNIKAFILDIIAAGSDTSALTIEWTLAELINHPTVFKKAREEIDTIIGKSRLVEESDIPNLPYLQAIVKETLRLHPGAPLIVRQSVRDCNVSGYDIPANTRTFVNLWAIGRDPKNWDHPLEFRPERFMPSKEVGWTQIDLRGQHFHYLPFGTGARACPGTTLALHLVQTAVATMIQCFDWKVCNGDKTGAVDMSEGAGLGLPMAHHLVCVPVARLNPFESSG